MRNKCFFKFIIYKILIILPNPCLQNIHTHMYTHPHTHASRHVTCVCACALYREKAVQRWRPTSFYDYAMCCTLSTGALYFYIFLELVGFVIIWYCLIFIISGQFIETVICGNIILQRYLHSSCTPAAWLMPYLITTKKGIVWSCTIRT